MSSTVVITLPFLFIFLVFYLVGREIIRTILGLDPVTILINGDNDFRNSPENMQERERLWIRIMRNHRHIKAERRRLAVDESIGAMPRRGYIDGLEVQQRFFKDVLAIRGIPVWLTDARLELLDEELDRNESNGEGGEDIPF